MSESPRAIHHRHVKVHQNDVRTQLMRQFYGARSIFGFAHHLQTLERFDKLADSLTHHIVVIGNQNSGGVITARPLSSCASHHRV